MSKFNQQPNVENVAEANKSRRNFIKLSSAASLVCWSSTSPSLLAKNLNNKPRNKIVWVILRGALDSLHTVIPMNEPNMKHYRPKLFAQVQNSALPLTKQFSLHPSLKNLHQWYIKKELLPVVAVSSGYKARSHFDGQDFLESGKSVIDHDSGFLARAVDIKHKHALSISHSVPVSLRGSRQSVNTWYPSNLKESKEDLFEQLARLYKNNKFFSSRLEEAMTVKEMAEQDKTSRYKGKFKELATSCGNLLKNEQTDCAMLELGGWDTHNNQAGRLTRKLKELDDGLGALKQSLGAQWQNTVLMVATEFGRTVKENGTLGTDHGTASSLFFAGGQVDGGQVLGEWPGLDVGKLFEGRDLMPTSNTFSWVAKVFEQHWDLSSNEVESVFPDKNLSRAKENIMRKIAT